MAERNEKHLDPKVWAWVQGIAARDHGGDWRAAVAAILTAAYVAELAPDDPWAYLQARSRGGAKPGG